MSDTDTMKFGPQWLRQLSDGGGNVCSPPPTPAANLGPFGKFKLADFRYGKEEMLALYRPFELPPECLKCLTEIRNEIPQNPVSVVSLTEEEQRLLMHGVNSDQVYRLMSNTHRSVAVNESGGVPSVELTISRGSSGTGTNGAGRGGRGRGRRESEPFGDSTHSAEAASSGELVHNQTGQLYHRGSGSRGRGSRNNTTNSESCCRSTGVGYRGQTENIQPNTEIGDSNGDWRRVSRQRNPSESDTDWRKGPRIGSNKDNSKQRATTVVLNGNKVGFSHRDGSSRNDNDLVRNEVGSWRQKSGGFALEQKPFTSSPGIGGRGRGQFHNRGISLQRTNSEEMPEWIYDENCSEEANTGFFDSCGAYKPSVQSADLNSGVPRARQHSTGSSVTGGESRNHDLNDYWEDDWETDFTLYDDLDGSVRHDIFDHEDKQSSSEECDINGTESQLAEPNFGRILFNDQNTEDDLPIRSADQTGLYLLSTSREPTDHIRQTPQRNKHCIQVPDVSSCSTVTPELYANGKVDAIADVTGGDSKLEHLICSDSNIQSVVTSDEKSEEEVIPSPFSQTDSPRWFYRDPQGKTQGPFTPSQMLEWYKAGFFDHSLAVRRECDDGFYSLESFFKTFGSQTYSGSTPPNDSSLETSIPTVNHIGMPLITPESMQLILCQQKVHELFMKHQQQQYRSSPENNSRPTLHQATKSVFDWHLLQKKISSIPGQVERQQTPTKFPFPKLSSSSGVTSSFHEPQIPLSLDQVELPSQVDSFTISPSPASEWILSGSEKAPTVGDTNVPEEVMDWHKNVLAQQKVLPIKSLAHQKVMKMQRQVIERERELFRQQEALNANIVREAENNVEQRKVQESDELEKRRGEVEFRDIQFQTEEAERRIRLIRQEEERRELAQRPSELAEKEKSQAALVQCESNLLEKVMDEAAGAYKHVKVVKAQEFDEMKELSEIRNQWKLEEIDRIVTAQEGAEKPATSEIENFCLVSKKKKDDSDRKRLAADSDDKAKKIKKKGLGKVRTPEIEDKEKNDIGNETTERKKLLEEEMRRLQISEFKLPDSSRWGSSGQTDSVSSDTVSVVYHSSTPNLAEIQRHQLEKEQRQIRAIRLEQEAMQLSTQRVTQLGPWNTGTTGIVNSPYADCNGDQTDPASSSRLKSFIEIQAEEQAIQEVESSHSYNHNEKDSNTKGVVSVDTATTSVWKLNWTDKTRPTSFPATQKNLVSKTIPVKAAPTVQIASPSVKQTTKSVWGCTPNTSSIKSKLKVESQHSKATLVCDNQSTYKKKNMSRRDEERVTKLFAHVEGNQDNELTRWCKIALDRLTCPTQLDKSMFVDYLIQMETGPDIEDMMTAYYNDISQIKEFVNDFLEKRRLFNKAIEDGTEISFNATVTSDSLLEGAFLKVGSTNKTGGKRSRKRKQQKVSNWLNITATADPERFNAGEIDYAN